MRSKENVLEFYKRSALACGCGMERPIWRTVSSLQDVALLCAPNSFVVFSRSRYWIPGSGRMKAASVSSRVLRRNMNSVSGVISPGYDCRLERERICDFSFSRQSAVCSEYTTHNTSQ
jgi:hypothetical protein